MTLKAGKGMRGGGAKWGHRVGGRAYMFSPPLPQPKILYETLLCPLIDVIGVSLSKPHTIA